jgi:hypothetical protein
VTLFLTALDEGLDDRVEVVEVKEWGSAGA